MFNDKYVMSTITWFVFSLFTKNLNCLVKLEFILKPSEFCQGDVLAVEASLDKKNKAACAGTIGSGNSSVLKRSASCRLMKPVSTSPAINAGCEDRDFRNSIFVLLSTILGT